MNVKYLALGAALSCACTNVETSLIIQHAAAPDDPMSCELMDDGDVYDSEIFVDVTGQSTMSLNLRVQNMLQGGTLNFGSDENPDDFQITNKVTPLRFDLRWECDTTGFSDDLGDMYVPQFSATEPFCVGSDTRSFSGFDVIPASGNTIEPGGDVALVSIRPITVQLMDAFADVFRLAGQAQECCNSAGACNDQALQQAPMGPGTPCGILQAEFDRIAGEGRLNAQSFADIQKFRPFAIYDYNQNAPRPGFAGYPMRLRGVLEGVTSDDTVVRSDEWWIIVNLCANCGLTTPCTL